MEQLGFLIRQNAKWQKRIIFPWDLTGCQLHLQTVNTNLINISTVDGSAILTLPSQLDWTMTTAQCGALPVPPIYPTMMPNSEQAAFLDNYILSIKWSDTSVTEEMEGPLYIAAFKPF